MRTRTVLLVTAAAVILAGGSAAVGAVMFDGDEPPTATATSSPVPATKTETTAPSPSATPTTTATTTPASPTTTTPTSASPSIPAVLNGAVVKEVFPGLSAPIPSGWVGQSSDEDSHTYADTSSCTTKAKECPQVQFLSLVSGSNRVNYGSNPVQQWAKNVCPSRSPDSVSSMGTFVADGKSVAAYEFACQGIENYAWYVPGELLVLAGDAHGGVAVPSTVQAVLKYARVG